MATASMATAAMPATTMAAAAMAAAAAAAAMAAMPSRHSSAYIDDQCQRDDPENFCKFRHHWTSTVTPRKINFHPITLSA
jgi:hypothetical protein